MVLIRSSARPDSTMGLLDLGYVDRKALAQARKDAGAALVVPDLLCDVLALEVGLRSLM
ncbi:hypothetical protein [Streptomyces sp. TRM49041]|uniref:hypothetical protein n=1 Tax=Streptomyces sp. TRM49041 TaxID=2603216 RepID=UPI0016568760|nr:hypothetical protein [Streptomyces sp. TRM49041]